MKSEENVLEVGPYNVQILEPIINTKNGIEFFPVLIDYFQGMDWKGKKRIYISKTMSETKLTELFVQNPFVVEQLFAMKENQQVSLCLSIDVIKYNN